MLTHDSMCWPARSIETKPLWREKGPWTNTIWRVDDEKPPSVDPTAQTRR
ncbi:hypothetical protein JG688_00003697 [Phytophthora aleatoria]|uniref:Uncharacterized protein n=1 Tax=Phytophthora aleatoria TaxID=2496075 RepID=A0A8J5MHF9_9STRA|nr:hypothetical protein JG688_00003697 [Phytophthora aleatoria]